MFTTRVIGRNDGEVLVTAGLLAAAATNEARSAAANPTVPGMALCTIDGGAAARGEPALADALIVLDPGELRRADAFARLRAEAYLLVNATCGFGDLGLADRIARFCRDRALILPMIRLEPGLHEASIRSSGMIGGFAALSRIVSLDSVVSAIQAGKAGGPGSACTEAAMAAYEFVRAAKEALAV
jgi:pyruvate ferredoxin oxidoreductase gamma subunit